MLTWQEKTDPEFVGCLCPFANPCSSSKNKSRLLISVCPKENNKQLLQERASGTCSKKPSPSTCKGTGCLQHSCLPFPEPLRWLLRQVQGGRQWSLPHVTVFTLPSVPWLSLRPVSPSCFILEAKSCQLLPKVSRKRLSCRKAACWCLRPECSLRKLLLSP